MVDRDRARRRWVNWDRVPGRVVLFVTFFIAIGSLVLAVFPFTADSAATGESVHCGPPLFEVVVPVDPAFDVPENAVCPDAAQNRVIAAALGLVIAFLATVIILLRARKSTAFTQARWLSGPQGRRRPKAPVSRRSAASNV